MFIYEALDTNYHLLPRSGYMAIGNEESPTRRSGRRDSSRRGARNVFRTGPSPGQEVIDVDADEETMDVLEVAALIGRGGAFT